MDKSNTKLPKTETKAAATDKVETKVKTKVKVKPTVKVPKTPETAKDIPTVPVVKSPAELLLAQVAEGREQLKLKQQDAATQLSAKIALRQIEDASKYLDSDQYTQDEVEKANALIMGTIMNELEKSGARISMMFGCNATVNAIVALASTLRYQKNSIELIGRYGLTEGVINDVLLYVGSPAYFNVTHNVIVPAVPFNIEKLKQAINDFCVKLQLVDPDMTHVTEEKFAERFSRRAVVAENMARDAADLTNSMSEIYSVTSENLTGEEFDTTFEEPTATDEGGDTTSETAESTQVEVKGDVGV